MAASAAIHMAACLDKPTAPANSEGIRPPSGYVPEVDAMRALAMTAVIVFHCGLAPFGWMGVWLFFVVSGFAVTTSLFGGQSTVSLGHTIRRFYLRRALRIWPIYYVFIALNVAAILVIGNMDVLGDLPYLLTFTDNIRMILKDYTPFNTWGGFTHLWTLSVEQQFYVVFPLLLLLRGRVVRTIVLVGVIILTPLLRATVAHYADASDWDIQRSAFAVYALGPAHFDAFACGVLIALFRTQISDNRRIAWGAVILAAVVTVAYISVYLSIGVDRVGHVSLVAFRNIVSGILFGQSREIFVYMVPTSVAAALLVCILAGRPAVLRICQIPGLQAIGRISYGGYLFHNPVLMILATSVPFFTEAPANSLRGIMGHVGLLVCGYPLTLAIAWLSFRFFEQPISKLGRHRW